MVLEGRAREAIRLATIGGAGSLVVTVALLPFLYLILPPLYELIKPYIGFILIIASIYLIVHLSSSTERFLWSLTVFLLSGAMGWIVFETPISPGLGLMSLFTGFFGISTIIYSLQSYSDIPEQLPFEGLEMDFRIIRGLCAGGVAGTLLGFLPGFGPSQGGIIVQSLMAADEDKSPESFITALTGLNTSDALFSLLTLYLIGNPRSGIAVYISHIIQDIDFNHLFLFISVSLLAVSMGSLISLKVGDFLCNYMRFFDYRKLSSYLLLFMVITVFFFSYIEQVNILFTGLLIATSTAIGLIPHCTGISKSHLMGVLIIPSIVIYIAA